MQADDLHNALGRLLDQLRVASLKIVSLDAAEGASGGYTVRATIDEVDRETVEKLGRRIAKIWGVSGLEVRPVPHLRAVERPFATAC